MGLTQGRPPKNPEDRVRRNAAPGTIALPVEGYTGDIPFFPMVRPTTREIELWNFHWQLPQATMWVRQGLIFVIARYIRCLALIEEDQAMTVALSHIHSEVRQIEDRLGLSSLALVRLRWEVTTDQVEEMRDIQANHASAVRRLKAVDHKASGS